MSNPNTISWTHYQNIQIPDVTVRTQFDNYIKNGQYIEAINLLQTKEQQLQGKSFISDSITKIITGVLNLQSRFDENVNVFLTNLSLQYANMIDSFKKMGQWNSNVLYQAYNFVIYNDEIYMAITTVPSGFLPTDTNYWLKLGLKGNEGAPGADVNLRYEWNNTLNYVIHDLVSYQGNLYVALKDNTGVTPGTDETTWLPFLIITKGGIHVGANPPLKYVQNTVWFKVDADPLTSATPLIGQFYRYTNQGAWEEMYPQTLFNWVEGKDAYAPFVNQMEVIIPVYDWTLTGSQYSVEFENPLINSSSYIEVSLKNPLNTQEVDFYSTWSMDIKDRAIEFLTQTQPYTDVSVVIRVQ